MTKSRICPRHSENRTIFENVNVYVITYKQSFNQLIVMFTLHLEGSKLDGHHLQFPRQADISRSGDFNDLLQLVLLSLQGFIICRQFLHMRVWKENSQGTLADAQLHPFAIFAWVVSTQPDIHHSGSCLECLSPSL